MSKNKKKETLHIDMTELLINREGKSYEIPFKTGAYEKKKNNARKERKRKDWKREG